jgi:predicted esterase
VRWYRCPRGLLILAGLHCVASAVAAQGSALPPSTLTAHRAGEFDAVLPVRASASDTRRWAERFQFAGDLEPWDYDLATESFSVYVPADYDAEGEPFGVVVWISPVDDGGIPPDLRTVFDQRHLIWIGPNQAGNDRHLFVRSALALDAALNVRNLYHVDPDRVFVSGLSGGGKVAAMMAIDWADVFAGGFPIIGMATYLEVPLESNPDQLVLRFARPPADLLERAMRQPFVIMTGSGDFNREECRLSAAAYERDGFSDVHLVDVEGMGHEMPSADDFARALDALLAPTS